MTLRDTELKEFDDDRGEAKCMCCQQHRANEDDRDSLLEEQRFVSGIRLDVLLERLVLHERVIRPESQVNMRARPNTRREYNLRQHHQCASFLVNILVRPLPLFPDPLLTEEQLEVVIGHRRG